MASLIAATIVYAQTLSGAPSAAAQVLPERFARISEQIAPRTRAPAADRHRRLAASLAAQAT